MMIRFGECNVISPLIFHFFFFFFLGEKLKIFLDHHRVLRPREAL